MGFDIVTMGPLICEVMRKELDKPLDRPADFTGPYPSGDAAIMLNAASKLGAKCAMTLRDRPPGGERSGLLYGTCG